MFQPQGEKIPWGQMTRGGGKNKYPINQTVKHPAWDPTGTGVTNRNGYPTGLPNLFCLK